MASPEEGVAKYFKVGTFIPVLNYKISRVAESPYATTVVIGEYDGWADPPDRPWNLVALANSVLGILYVHGPAIWDADPAAVPSENTTVDGNVTTHLVPTENLPLAQPFRDFGIHDTVMDNVDRFLRPIVDAGYVRHDQPGDTRPAVPPPSHDAAAGSTPNRRHRPPKKPGPIPVRPAAACALGEQILHSA